MIRRSAVVTLLALLALARSASGDIAYPARLDLEESSPGQFDVLFTVPVVEGRTLRARPIFPPGCRDSTVRETSTTASGHTLEWEISCEPSSLAGEAIFIEGLLGTQVDLAFTLGTLDGRVYSRILRPSRPGFLVPEPPSAFALAAEAAVAGMRRTLRNPFLWMLILVAALAGTGWRGLLAAALTFASAQAVGQELGAQSWLQIGLPQRDLIILAALAVPAVAVAGAGPAWRKWIRPLFPLGLFLGLVCGGARPEALAPEGLSEGEQYLVLVLFAFGVVLAWLLMSAAAAQLEAVLLTVAEGRHREGALRWLGYGVGALATGILIAKVAGIALVAPGPRWAPLALVPAALMAAPTLALTGWTRAGAMSFYSILTALAATAGINGLSLPFLSTLAFGSLLLLGAALAANRVLPVRAAALTSGLAIVSLGYLEISGLIGNVSRSAGVAVGATVLGAGAFYAVFVLTRQWQDGRLPVALRSLGLGVAAYAFALRWDEYRTLFDRRFATEMTLGVFRLPVLALLFLAAALLVWPRRRRVLAELGIDRPRRSFHWILLLAAWLALPFGTLALPIPFHETRVLEGEDARRILGGVLSETYRAFNLENEEELYDRLAENVTGELIEDLYLDSRRRLTAGTREGAEVTVQDVEVLEVGEPNGDDDGSLAYNCRWVVTARVRHLQHVHHRRNVYNGVLTLKVDNERWKIARVELHSEERNVVPWKPA
jgi:hypothetical protein